MENGNQPSALPPVDPTEFAKNMAELAQRSQQMVQEFMAQKPDEGDTDPLNVSDAFLKMTQAMMDNPAKLAEAQMNLWQNYMTLWTNSARQMMGEAPQQSVSPEKGDKRFKDAQWDENQIFSFIKQSYLLTSRWMQDVVQDVEGLDKQTADKVAFYTRQFADAMAPSNFLLTNPTALKATMDENGANLVRGMDNMLDDMRRGKGKLAIKMTDYDAFKVGENIAVTPGQVVWQSDLMQLIQYEPTTEKVYKRPLLIVPPWINKFYILDLKPQNSFIKWAVDEGFTVFVVSWVNPDAQLADKSFEDYMHEGVLEALDGVTAATGERDVTAIGYCLGGTLMAATLAYMKAVNDDRIKAVTFFTAMVDFTEPGDLGVFIDEEQLAALDKKMQKSGGYLDGSDMAGTFNMLRANDLIWSFVVNNYLLGKEPFPFDLLYWNSDSTRMPREMHMYYLHNMYRQNLLVQPGALRFKNVAIDLGKIDIPVHIVSTKEDHIAPWKSTYAATQLYQGPITFTLAGSGHIAGIVNPPSANKYGYWQNTDLPPNPEDWLAGATEHAGSWWPQWGDWVGGHSGNKVKARKPGSAKAKPIEAAPGSYVKQRSDQN